jgi:SagB-type dehydrogenase family enzyme
MNDPIHHRSSVHLINGDLELIDLYWQNTEIHPATSAAYGARLATSLQTPPAARAGSDQPIVLAKPEIPALRSAERRASQRTPTVRPATLTEISQLFLPLASRTDSTRGHPSAGGLYSVDTYLVETAPSGHDATLPLPGRFRYDAELHALEPIPISPGGTSNIELVEMLNAPDEYQPALVLVLIGDTRRLAEKYGARALRFLLLEAGAMAQSVSLCAAELGLGTLWLGGACDRPVAELLDRSGDPVLAVLGVTA